MLPANGYLVIAFITGNPGAWLIHCHIAWYIGLGLGSQFLES
jgi:FtsP/CotA-like multicopper oxidase with cupredoxin domain